MTLSDYYNDIDLGLTEPEVFSLAEAMLQLKPEKVLSTVTPKNNKQGGQINIVGRYSSHQVNQDIQFFTCDIKFNDLFQTKGILPAGLWFGAIFSGEWCTQIADHDIHFDSNGIPTLVAIDEESIFYDQPLSHKRVKMSSVFISQDFFRDMDRDDPDNHFAAMAQIQQQGFHIRSLGYHSPLTSALYNLIKSPYQGKLLKLHTENLVMTAVFECAKVIDQLTPQKKSDNPYTGDVAYDARLYIDTHMADFQSVTQLASQLGTNETTLRQQFKATFGVTIFEYLIYLRMNAAQKLIKDGHLSIAEIGHRVGYTTPANFTTAYKKFFGTTPAKDRVA